MEENTVRPTITPRELKDIQSKILQFQSSAELAWRRHPHNPWRGESALKRLKDQASHLKIAAEVGVNNALTQRSLATLTREAKALTRSLGDSAVSTFEEGVTAQIKSLRDLNPFARARERRPSTELRSGRASSVSAWSNLDIVIAGAGPVGLWTGLQILLHSRRSSGALPSPRLVFLEKRLGGERARSERGYQARERIVHVSSSLRDLISSPEIDATALVGGHAIHELQASLEHDLRRLGGESQVKLITEVDVSDYLTSSDPCTFLSELGAWGDFHPRMLIGCDGRRSVVRRAYALPDSTARDASEELITQATLFHSLTLSVKVDPEKSEYSGRMKVLEVGRRGFFQAPVAKVGETLHDVSQAIADEMSEWVGVDLQQPARGSSQGPQRGEGVILSSGCSVLATVNRKSKRHQSEERFETATVILIFGDEGRGGLILPKQMRPSDQISLRELSDECALVIREFLTELGATPEAFQANWRYLPIDMYHTDLSVLAALGHLSPQALAEGGRPPAFLLGDACLGVPYQQALNHGFKTSYDFVSGLYEILKRAQEQSDKVDHRLTLAQAPALISAVGSMYQGAVGQRLRDAFSEASVKTEQIEWGQSIPLLLDVHNAVFS